MIADLSPIANSSEARKSRIGKLPTKRPARQRSITGTCGR